MKEILIVVDYLKKNKQANKQKQKKINLVFEFTVFIQIQSVIYINLFLVSRYNHAPLNYNFFLICCLIPTSDG